MSSKINLQTCEYARKSSIFQDNQLIFHKHIDNLINLNGNPSFNAVANTDKTRPDKHVSC